MKRLRIIIIIVVAVLFLGILAIAIFRAREPHYKGRTLSEWILVTHDPRRTHNQWIAATNAIRLIGPAAIPTLLRWAQANDSPFKKRLVHWVYQHPFIQLRFRQDMQYLVMAEEGLCIIGDDAKAARPTLVQWTYSKDHRYKWIGLQCFDATSPDRETFLPLLLRLINDSDTDIQEEAISILRYRYPEDAKAAGVYKVSPEPMFNPIILPPPKQAPR